jgi:hypothetical protein
MFRPHQFANLAGRVCNLRETEIAAAWKDALHITMTASCTDHMCRNDQAGAVNEGVVDCIAQIDGGPVWIEGPHVTQGREAIAHVLLRKVQAHQCFGCGALKDLLP